MIGQALRRWLLVGVTAALGCAPPIQIEKLEVPANTDASVLVVMIAGVTDTAQDIREHQVFETLSDSVGPVDAFVVYREAPSYIAGKFPTELHRRIVKNRSNGAYARRVLVGFSSGGTAALEYASTYADEFDAVILYAPYLGPQYIIDEIRQAGGLADWAPNPPIEDQERLWWWLKDYAADPSGRPRVHVLWGANDHAAPGLDLLQESWPKQQLTVGEGEHGWPAFNDMWPAFVRTHGTLFVR